MATTYVWRPGNKQITLVGCICSSRGFGKSDNEEEEGSIISAMIM